MSALSDTIERVIAPLTFFSSPPSLRLRVHAVANLITDADPFTCALTLSHPLHAAAVACFFDGDPAIPVDPQLPLPKVERAGRQETLGSFQLSFHHFLYTHYGHDILARLATPRLEDEYNYYERAIIADCDSDLDGDMRYLAAHFASRNQMLIRFREAGTDATFTSPCARNLVVSLPTFTSHPDDLTAVLASLTPAIVTAGTPDEPLAREA